MKRTPLLFVSALVVAVWLSGCDSSENPRADRSDSSTTKPSPKSQTPDPAGVASKLKALEDAHKQGVLNDAEYARKKAALQAQMAPAVDGATRKKLAALEAARKSGILSDAEYTRKKAELMPAATPVIDEATRAKLVALETARKSGILSDAEYQRKKAALMGTPSVAPPVRPPAGTPPAVQPRPAAPAVPTATKGKTYRHLIGFTFWYPDTWTVKEQQGPLLLVPPNPGTQNGEPTEAYVIIGESLTGEGITSADDPRVIAYLHQQVQGISSILQRAGGATPVAMSKGKGIELNWQGKNPQGQRVVARAFATVINNYGVALVAVGLEDRVKARDAELRKVFSSFGFGQGQKDPQLLGRWQLFSTYGLRNDSPWVEPADRARMASDSSSVLTFGADGTWKRTDTHHMIALGSGVGLESKESNTKRGRWNAADGSLYMIWEDNSWEDYTYRIENTPQGRRLKLNAGKTGQVWTPVE